jgi:hypothetical protein
MRIKYPFLFLLLFFVLKINAQNIQNIVNQTSLANITQSVNELSGEIPTTVGGNPITIAHRVSSAGNNDAADYIKERIEAFGLPVVQQDYSAGGRNIIATQTGVTNPNNIYIISAHYDAVNLYGADDNASGTAAIIELARILSQYCTDNTIVYALWDEEETGLNGSAYYAQQAQTNGDNILGNFNIDMMGYDADNDKNFDIDVRNIAGSLAMKDDIIGVLNNPAYGLDLIVNVVDPGTGSSDHGSFWNNGYSAVLFGECWSKNDKTSGYHSSNDRIGLFNMPYYHQMCKLVVAYITTVASPIFIDKTVTQNTVSITSNETGATYQWVDCNNSNAPISGQTNQQFTPAINGNYAVQITKNNCIKLSVCTSFNVLGIDDYQLQNIALFPNPVKESLTITGIQNNSPVLNAKLVSITGKEIFKKRLTNSNNNINMQSLSTGIYFLDISTINGVKKVFKVIKQ